MTDQELMGLALEEAKKAAALGEVPVGAVVAKDRANPLPWPTTPAKPRKMPCTMPSCWPSMRPQKSWVAGAVAV